MGGKKAAPQISAEEALLKAEEALLKAKEKAWEKLAKACKDDEIKKCEEAVAKGADVDHFNDKGNTAAHIAAGFGSLRILCYLHKRGANLAAKNLKKQKPIDLAKDIGEDGAVKLIEALIAGKSDVEIEAILRDDDDDSGDETEEATPEPPPPPVGIPPLPSEMADAKITTETEQVTKPPQPDPEALQWSDVHGDHQRAIGEACAAHGTLTVKSAPGIEPWVTAVGAEAVDRGGAVRFRILASQANSGDCMLLGLVDAVAGAAGARESRQAVAVTYNPGAGEVWVHNHGRVVERHALEQIAACLYGNAVGSEVHVGLDAHGSFVLRTNNAEPVAIPVQTALPTQMRPYARMGRAGDTVALLRVDPVPKPGVEGSGDGVSSKAAKHRVERTSNVSVITEAAMPT